MVNSPEFSQFDWMPPRAYSAGRPSGQPLWVVLHYTAGSERPSSAEDGAAYDQTRTDGTSAHFYVDQDSVVQSVATWDRSHTAMNQGNARGIHIEMCGTVQTRAQWLDAASRPTIRNAALVAALCMTKYAMPNQKLSVAQVAGRSARGYCDHGTVTAAFPADKGDHTDVGSGFPWDVFAADLASFLEDEMELDTPLDKIRDVGTAIREIHAATHSVLNDAKNGLNVRVTRIEQAVAAIKADLAERPIPAIDMTALIEAVREQIPTPDEVAAALIRQLQGS